MTQTEKRFFSLIKTDETDPEDVERLQLFYVIARTDALWKNVDSIYDFSKHALKNGWEELSYGTFKKMLKRAIHLYSGGDGDIDSVTLYWGMDSYNAETMINAQLIYLRQYDFTKKM